MRSPWNGWLFMHGYIGDADLARRLADESRLAPRPLWRRLAALFGWLGRGAVRAWPH